MSIRCYSSRLSSKQPECNIIYLAAINKSSYHSQWCEQRRPDLLARIVSMDSCTLLVYYIWSYLFIHCWFRRPWCEREQGCAVRGLWQSAGIELVSLRLWNPSRTPGGHHNRDEDVVSSHVAVPPMIIYALWFIPTTVIYLYHHMIILISVVAFINQYLKVSSW